MNVKILVATHKNYAMPADQELYMPIFVGKEIHPTVNETFQGDNTGENISKKNPNYNELTAIYWAWKNLPADAIGLVHYRRYLSYTKEKNLNTILNKKQVDELLSKNDIILPKKRNYYIQSNYSHYVHAHHAEPMDVTREIIDQNYSSYLKSFDKVMGLKSAHMFNMFIMKKEPFDQYCEWLFSILGKLEERIDISTYNQYESRVFGFISERLLDVWLDVNSHYRVKEVNFVYMEKQNWIKKGGEFLKRIVKPNY